MIEPTDQFIDAKGVDKEVKAKRIEIPLGVKMEIFKNGREHFLAYAIQNQTKIPTLKSILRTERRQQTKKRVRRDQARRPPKRVNNASKREQPTFILPKKYGLPSRLRRTNKTTNGHRNRRVPRRNLNSDPRVPNPTDLPMPLRPIIPPPFGMHQPFLPIIGLGPRPIPPPPGSLNPPSAMVGLIQPPFSMRVPNYPEQMRSITRQGAVSLIERPIPPYNNATNSTLSKAQDLKFCIDKPSSPILPLGFGLGAFLPSSVVKVDSQPLGVIEPPAIKSKHVYPKHPDSISLPRQITQKPKVERTINKTKNINCKVKSPESLILKSERSLIIKYLAAQAEQKDQGGNNLERAVKNQNIPDYFKKKKASQKRRRKEKHELIKANRSQLVSIFGDAIFQRGWPVSRKEIKLALGITEEEPEIDLQEFIKLTQQEQTTDKVQPSIQVSLERS